MAPYNNAFLTQLCLSQLCLAPCETVTRYFSLDTDLVSRIVKTTLILTYSGPFFHGQVNEQKFKCIIRVIYEIHFIIQIFTTSKFGSFEYYGLQNLTIFDYKLRAGTLKIFQQFGNLSGKKGRVRIEVSNYETLLYTAIANAKIYLANVSKFDENDRSTYYENIVSSLPVLAVKSNYGLDKFKQLIKDKITELSREKTIIDNKYYSPFDMEYGDDLTAAIASIPNEYVHSDTLKAYYNLINLPPKVELTDDNKRIIETACDLMGYIPSYEITDKIIHEAHKVFSDALYHYRFDVQYAPPHAKMVNRSFTKEGSPVQFDLMREEKIIFDFSLGLFP